MKIGETGRRYEKPLYIQYIYGSMKYMNTPNVEKYVALQIEKPDASKGSLLIEAGFAPTTSRIPLRVEQTQRYKEAATRAGLMSVNKLEETLKTFDAADLSKLTPLDLLNVAEKLSKIAERMMPKEAEEKGKKSLRDIFADAVTVEARDVTDEPSEPVAPLVMREVYADRDGEVIDDDTQDESGIVDSNDEMVDSDEL